MPCGSISVNGVMGSGKGRVIAGLLLGLITLHTFQQIACRKSKLRDTGLPDEAAKDL